jgi:hypothetical protein
MLRERGKIMGLLERQKSLYPQNIEYINEVNNLINELSKLKINEVSTRIDPPIPIVAWKLKSYVQTSLHRILDLAIDSCRLWEEGSAASTFLLTRSVLETAYFLFDFTNQIKEYIDNQDLHNINILVNKIKYGERNQEKLPKIDNVLTIMDRVSKFIPYARTNYENISSFCHPNYSALGMLYSFQDNENLCFRIGKKYGNTEEYFNIIIRSLSIALNIQKMAMERFNIIYPELEKLEENEMKNISKE